MVNPINIPHRTMFETGRLPALLLLALGLVLAACSDSVGPAPTGEFSSGDYTWSSTNTLDYRRAAQNAEFRHTLRFLDGTVEEEVLDASSNLVASNRLSLSNDAGSILLTGCDVNSLFHIPSDMRFEDRITSVPGPSIRAISWITLDASTILAGNANGGLFRYGTRSNAWIKEDTPSGLIVTAMDLDSSLGSRRLLIGTESNGILARTLGDSTWRSLNAPSGRVDDVDADVDGTVFAVIDGNLYESRAPSFEWRPFSITSVANDVAKISILPVTVNESILFIARRKGGLAQIYLMSSYPAQLSLTERFAQEEGVDVRTSLTSGYSAIAAANPPMLYVAPQGIPMWASVPVRNAGTITTVCQSDRGGTVLIGTENGMYRFDGAPPEPSGLSGKHIISLHYGPDGAFYCGTTTGTFRSGDEGRMWTQIDEGSTVVRTPTGITLLPARFSVGSSWDAARTIVQGSGAITLRGRVLEHFDELLLPGDLGTYEDVIVVRYAQELPDGSRVPDTFSWTVYHARGKGPVYFEETLGSDLRASAWLTVP